MKIKMQNNKAKTYNFNFLKFWAKHDGATDNGIKQINNLAFPKISRVKIIGNAPNAPIIGFQSDGAVATYAEIGRESMAKEIDPTTYICNLVDLCLLAGWFKKIDSRRFKVCVPCGGHIWEITTHTDNELEHRCCVLLQVYSLMMEKVTADEICAMNA